MMYEKKIETKKVVYIAVAICAIHALTLLKSIPTFSSYTPIKDESQAIKLKIISELSKSKQIVQTNKSKDKLEAKKAFLGKAKSTFARQTVAKDIGTFKDASRGSKDATSSKSQSQAKNQKKVDLKKLALEGFSPVAKQVQKTAKSVSSKKGVKRGTAKKVGLSKTNDYIKDVALGDFTRLNTQEFEFYGFYHRIRQKLEQFWGRNIQEQAQKIAKQGRSIASGTNHVTALQIELNSNGEIVNVKVKGESGVKELDQTAIKTFNEAGPFPNPPKKMLVKGRVFINWSFVVTT